VVAIIQISRLANRSCGREIEEDMTELTYKGYALKDYKVGEYPIVIVETCDEFGSLEDAQRFIDSGEVDYSE
jgi:hypothetical protein